MNIQGMRISMDVSESVCHIELHIALWVRKIREKYPRGGSSLRDHLMHAYLSQMHKLR